MDGLNPTRRYKWFRPRQSARGSVNSTDAGANTAVYLYNDTTGSQLIVVRHFHSPVVTNAGDVEIGYVTGKHGSKIGNVQPYLSSGGKLPGIITGDTATTLAGYDYIPNITGQSLNAAYWPHEFPFAVLEPNVSLAFVSTSGSAGIPYSFIWEAIFVDELDFAFEL